MNIEQQSPNFTEYKFLSLLVTILYSEYHKSIIKKFELEKHLYPFYDNEYYHFLFEDIIKRSDVDGNNYVDLNDSF